MRTREEDGNKSLRSKQGSSPFHQDHKHRSIARSSTCVEAWHHMRANKIEPLHPATSNYPTCMFNQASRPLVHLSRMTTIGAPCRPTLGSGRPRKPDDGIPPHTANRQQYQSSAHINAYGVHDFQNNSRQEPNPLCGGEVAKDIKQSFSAPSHPARRRRRGANIKGAWYTTDNRTKLGRNDHRRRSRAPP